MKVFLKEYKASIEYVETNPAEAAQIIADQGIIPSAQIAEAAIPGSNIVYVDGEEMAADLASFYDILYSYNPDSVGGTVPDDHIYYIAE